MICTPNFGQPELGVHINTALFSWYFRDNESFPVTTPMLVVLGFFKGIEDRKYRDCTEFGGELSFLNH